MNLDDAKSEPSPHRREWPKRQSWTCANGGNSQGNLRTVAYRNVCPQQLASVSGLSVLGESDGRVRYLFYAILCIGRKSSYGPIPLNSVAKSVGGTCFVICCKSFCTSTRRLTFFRSALNCFCTVCALFVLSVSTASTPPSCFPLSVLLFLCLHSTCFCCSAFTFTSNQSLLLHGTKWYLLNCISLSLPTLTQ